MGSWRGNRRAGVSRVLSPEQPLPFHKSGVSLLEAAARLDFGSGDPGRKAHSSPMARHILVTGASAGIGRSIAQRLAQDDPEARFSLGARRVERLADVVPGAFTSSLDVTKEPSIEAFLQGATKAHGPVDVLVNNAGLARGTESMADADGRAWREMIETNLIGLLEITRRVLPTMVEREVGDVVAIGSIAGRETYPGGGVYCGTKRAVQSFCDAIRLDTMGKNIRVMLVEPGMVDTEFSLVRFRGDAAKAKTVYDGVEPLLAEDIADCVAFALSRPRHVCLDNILVKPTDQASATRVHRRN